MPVPTIEWKNNGVYIIDQTRLPHKYKRLRIANIRAMWWAIKRLKVRGAPAIGIAGAFGVVLGVRRGKMSTYARLRKRLDACADYLAGSRPTAVNLFWALERMKRCAGRNRDRSTAYIRKRLLDEAIRIMDEDRQMCRRMAGHGARLVRKGDNILTHCNAGGLATADYGTALGVLFRSRELGKRIHVYVDETRPLLQGARLTAWELKREGISVTLICDNMAASLMAKGKIDRIFVGADRIAKNGDTANKIGTYSLAVLAKHHNVPFYVVAPSSTLDPALPNGAAIPIEQRDPDEVTQVQGRRIAPRGIGVYNPAFDVTPHGLITAIVTDKGVFRPPYKFRAGPRKGVCDMRIERLGEFGFIEHIKATSPKTRRALLGIGDDCAVVPYSASKCLLLTQDMLIEKRHFIVGKNPAHLIGRKALAVSLSDIAAMAGVPRFYMVSLGIPRSMSMNFLDGFYKGMKDVARKFRVELIGGDTNRSGLFCCDILVVGEAEKRRLVRRDGARPGDAIFVTGALGGGRGGRQFTFTPRIREAQILARRFKVSSMIDISDGLAGDINRIAEASRAGAILFEQAIPLAKGVASVREALIMGEDYELLFTVKKGSAISEKEISRVIGVPVRKLGYIVQRRYGITLQDAVGRKRVLEPEGFDHFR